MFHACGVMSVRYCSVSTGGKAPQRAQDPVQHCSFAGRERFRFGLLLLTPILRSMIQSSGVGLCEVLTRHENLLGNCFANAVVRVSAMTWTCCRIVGQVAPRCAYSFALYWLIWMTW